MNKLALALLLTLPLSPLSHAQEELFHFHATGQGFGRRLAIDEGLLAVTTNSGIVHLHHAESGQHLRQLTGSDNDPSFGGVVALGNGYLVVGAGYHSNGAGRVYVIDSATGAELYQLGPPPGQGDDLFGWAVATDGGRILVGAPDDDDLANNAGTAYLYDAATGQLLQQFQQSVVQPYQSFGHEVALDGDHVLVGAGWEDVAGGENNGAAYLFDANTGQLLHRLTATNPVDYDYFGNALDVEAPFVVIGSPINSLAVHVFDLLSGAQLHLIPKWDAFLIEVDDTSGALLSSTFLGGSGNDTADGGVVTDGAGSVFMGGFLSSGFQPAPRSETFDTESYVAKIHFGMQPPTPGISVAPVTGLETSEGGGTDGFTVVLNTAPTALVSISITTSDASEGLVSSGAQGPTVAVTLEFDGATWNLPQTVTVTGQDDPDLDGDVAYALATAAAVSADIDYAGLDAADVLATNFDDEAPAGIAVTGITPDSMDAGTSISVTITGSGFQPGASVTLENGTGPSPNVSNVVVQNGTTIEATFTAGSGGPKGIRTWDVRVTNLDSSTGVLVQGFDVVR